MGSKRSDCDRLLYVVNEDEGDHGLFAVRSDGDHRRKLTDFDAYPVLSQTASVIALWVRGSDGGATLFVADIDGTNQKKLADLVDDVGPVWSPDETRLAFSDYSEDDFGDGDFEVFVVAVDGSASAQQVTRNSTNDDVVGPVYGSWSPDSSRVAFSRDFGASYTEDRPDNFTKMFVMDADGSGLRPLVDPLTVADYLRGPPVCSPDGTRIAFSDGRDGDNEVFVIDADGSNLHQFTHNDSHDHAISWL